MPEVTAQGDLHVVMIGLNVLLNMRLIENWINEALCESVKSFIKSIVVNFKVIVGCSNRSKGIPVTTVLL